MNEQESTQKLFDEPMVIINLGLKGFADSLEVQGVEVVHLAWSPPAGGDPELIRILDDLL